MAEGGLDDKTDVVNAVYQGNLVTCIEEEYQNRVQRYLHEYAGQHVNNGIVSEPRLHLMKSSNLTVNLINST